jgi:hypothetical protein
MGAVKAFLPLLVLVAGCAARPDGGWEPFVKDSMAFGTPRVAGEEGLWIGSLRVCRERVEKAEVVDFQGGALVLRVADAWRLALLEQTSASFEKQLSVRIDGRTVMTPFINEPVAKAEMMLMSPDRRLLARLRRSALRRC